MNIKIKNINNNSQATSQVELSYGQANLYCYLTDN